jgi:carboxyl-terminal processing protease
LVRRGVLNTFALDHVEQNRDKLLAQYPDPASFRKRFKPGAELMNALVDAASRDGIEPDPEGFAVSKPLIELRLKALIARDLWNTSAYWQVINAENPVDRSFQKALETLSDNTFQRLGMTR